MARKVSVFWIWMLRISCLFYLLSSIAFAVEGDWSSAANRALISLLSGTLAASWRENLR